MKLQKQLSKKRGEKKYYRYVINIPSKLIKKLGFKAGDELKAGVKGNKLIIGRD